MKKQRSLACEAGRVGVLASAVAAALGTGAPAFAQETLDEVVVTGSRIVRRDLEANSPIVTLDADRLQESSTIAIESVINQMPQFVPAASQFESEGTSTGGYQSGPTRTVGSATLSLRGLGSNRNLVLIDGRRAQPVNANMAVNINSIPSAAVARIETITGGASSVYGADAIAGVVNFVLKSDYEGLDFDMQWGQTAEGDGTEQRFSTVLGTNFSDDRGNVLIGFEKSERGEIRKRDREFFQTGYADPANIGDGRITAASIVLDATNAPPIGVIRQLFPGAPTSGRTGSFYLNSDGSLYRSNGWGANRYTGPFLDSDGTTAWRKLESDGDLSQNRTHLQAQYPLDRYSLFTKGHFQLTDDIRLFGQGIFVDSTGRAIGPLNAFVGGWGASVPHGSNIYAPSLNADGTTNAAYLAGGPYGLNCPATGGCTNSQAWPKPPEVALLADARPNPNAPLTFGHNPNYVGAKVNTTDNTTYQLTYGLQGDLPGKDWTWELYASHGETQLQSTFEGNGRLEGWRFLTNFPNYGKGLEFTGNDFGDGFGAGTVYCTTGWNVMYGVNGMTETLYDDGPQGFMPSQDCIDAVTYIGKDNSTMVQDIAEFNLQGGLVSMPAGQLRFAVGASDRENDYRYIPDSLVTNAAIVDNTAGVYPADASFGAISATDVYGELLVPLLAGKRGVEEMTLELGYRKSSNEPTEDVDSYKALLDWRVTDRIRIRGGHQVANRAPNVAELFQSREQQFYYINNGDWCSEENPVNPNSPNPALNPNAARVKSICETRMGAAGASVFYSSEQPDEARSARWFYVVGNPNLVSESAGTTTLGVVANITDQATLSVDYWNIKISDMVSSEYVETFHEQCFSPTTNPSFDPNHPSCLKVERNQSTGGQSPYFVSFTNEAAIDMAGFDISFDWTRALGPGAMSLNLQASILDHAETQPNADSPPVDWKGSVGPSNISGLSGYSFDYRTITRLSYSQGDWTASLGWQHKPSITSEGHITNPSTATEVPTDAYDLFDLHGRYAFGSGRSFDVRFGIDNLFDAQPEIIFADATSSGTGRTDANIYDILGRRFYVGFTASF